MQLNNFKKRFAKLSPYVLYEISMQQVTANTGQDSLINEKTLQFSYLQRRHLVRVLGSGVRADGGQERAVQGLAPGPAVPGLASGFVAGPEEAVRRLSEPAPRSWAGPLNCRKFVLYNSIKCTFLPKKLRNVLERLVI
jgi:hypothetical protein